MPHADPIVRAEWQRAYRERNRERLSENGAVYRAANADRLAEQKKLDYERSKDDYKRRAKESRERNSEKLKAARSTPEYRERRNAMRRAQYVAHPKPAPKTREQVLADKRAEYERNKARYSAHARTYYAENKEKWKPYWERKEYWVRKFHRGLTKAKLKHAEIIDVESLREFYRQVYSKPESTCEYCRGVFVSTKITIDHRTPYALGGRHEVSNLSVSCLQCNLEKGETPYDKWRAL